MFQQLQHYVMLTWHYAMSLIHAPAHPINICFYVTDEALADESNAFQVVGAMMYAAWRARPEQTTPVQVHVEDGQWCFEMSIAEKKDGEAREIVDRIVDNVKEIYGISYWDERMTVQVTPCPGAASCWLTAGEVEHLTEKQFYDSSTYDEYEIGVAIDQLLKLKCSPVKCVMTMTKNRLALFDTNMSAEQASVLGNAHESLDNEYAGAFRLLQALAPAWFTDPDTESDSDTESDPDSE